MAQEHISTQCVCCDSRMLQASPAILMPFVAHRALGWAPLTIDESWGLKTIKKGQAYTVCRTMKCQDCGLLFLDIRFSDHEMSNLYKNYREGEYNQLRNFYEPGYLKRAAYLDLKKDYIDQIEAFLLPHLSFPINILDWGGDTGSNTPFQNICSSFDIYDISNKSVVAGARIVGRTELKKNTYHLIVCSHVLEHVPYPKKIIEEIKDTMNKSTILYIEVPFESIMENEETNLQLKRHWHEHINFFSERSLIRLTKNAGLELIESNQHRVNKNLKVTQLVCQLKK